MKELLNTESIEKRSVKYYPYLLGHKPTCYEYDYLTNQREACVKGMKDILENPPREFVERVLELARSYDKVDDERTVIGYILDEWKNEKI